MRGQIASIVSVGDAGISDDSPSPAPQLEAVRRVPSDYMTAYLWIDRTQADLDNGSPPT